MFTSYPRARSGRSRGGPAWGRVQELKGRRLNRLTEEAHRKAFEPTAGGGPQTTGKWYPVHRVRETVQTREAAPCPGGWAQTHSPPTLDHTWTSRTIKSLKENGWPEPGPEGHPPSWCGDSCPHRPFLSSVIISAPLPPIPGSEQEPQGPG